MRIGDQKIAGNIKIEEYEFEQVNKFKYLRSIIDSARESFEMFSHN